MKKILFVLSMLSISSQRRDIECAAPSFEFI